MTDYLFKCYCKNKHLESERVRKPGKRYGLNYHDLVWSRCACASYYQIKQIPLI